MVTIFAVIVSTLAGMFVGTLILVMFMPWLLLFMAFDPGGVAKFAVLFAVPTTAVVLPFVSLSVQETFSRTVCLLLFGTATGAFTQYLMMTHWGSSPFPRTDHAQMFLLTGGLAGLAAAAVFDGIVREGIRTARRCGP